MASQQQATKATGRTSGKRALVPNSRFAARLLSPQSVEIPVNGW